MTEQATKSTATPVGASAVSRPWALEAGLFCVLVAAPLVFTPFTAAPFVDPKLVLLIGAALLVAVSGVRVDGAVAAAAGAWVAVLGLATALGVDPWWSLLGPDDRGTGLLAFGAGALLLCAGTGVPEDLRERLPGWLFWTGAVVSAVAVVARFVEIGGDTWVLGFKSSTLGGGAVIGGFVAGAAVAGAHLRLRPAVVGGLVLLGSGLAVSASRGAWVGVALGLAIALWRGRRGWRTAAGVVLPLALTMAAWTLADPVLPEPVSAVSRFGDTAEASGVRFSAWEVNLRAWGEEPVLGSGPGTGWGRYLSEAGADEIRDARRGFADAHNIVLEFGVISGGAGVLALGVLFLVVALRARPFPPERAWAVGVVVAVGVSHLVQPLDVVPVGLMLLAGGLAVGRPPPGPGIAIRGWVPVLLAVALVLSTLRFGASSLERYGRTYASPSSLRASLVLQPFRLTAIDALAKHRALDARASHAGAGAEARGLAEEGVARHGWHPAVRLIAADVEMLLEDRSAARVWLNEHLDRFPNDPLALGGAARLALEAGEPDRARVLALRALEADPDLGLAEDVLEETGAEASTSSG